MGHASSFASRSEYQADMRWPETMILCDQAVRPPIRGTAGLPHRFGGPIVMHVCMRAAQRHNYTAALGPVWPRDVMHGFE